MSEKLKMSDQFGEILDVLNATLEFGGFETFKRMGFRTAVIRLNGIALYMEGKIIKSRFAGVSFRQQKKMRGTRPVMAPEDVFRKYIKAQEKINREYWGGKETFV